MRFDKLGDNLGLHIHASDSRRIISGREQARSSSRRVFTRSDLCFAGFGSALVGDQCPTQKLDRRSHIGRRQQIGSNDRAFCNGTDLHIREFWSNMDTSQFDD